MIRRVEELSLNAWPALQNMFYDGWILRISEGYTNRANSIQPIYSSNEDVASKIKICQGIYNSNDLNTVFKITSDVRPKNLDEILAERGYRKTSPTSVQVINLDTIQKSCLENFNYLPHVTEEWINSFYKLSKKDTATKSINHKMLNNILPNKFFVSMSINEKTIACGLGVLENDFIGLFDIVVDEQYRNKGYGKHLVLVILQLGKNNGAKKAYLQVEKKNAPALKLYSNIGFKEIYDYWYRVATA